MATINLTLSHEVRTEHNVRSSKDQRNKVIRVIAEYKDHEGIPYRKSFEAKGRMPEVPTKGTSAELNAKQYQW